MENLTISLIQSHLHWENPAKNREALEKHILSIPSTDLIVLPEMFTTAFTMEAEKNAETMQGESIKWMLGMAREKNAVVTGSLIVNEDGNYFNRLVWVNAHGDISTYDKRHLFSMADENINFKAGEKRLVASVKGWRVCPLICYDLRFPVWSRNNFVNGKWDYDLLLYVANWPSPRASAWEKLLYARAIENQCYTIGVNRIGTDEKGLQYIGGSMLIDMKGEVMASATQNKEEIIQQTIAPDSLIEFRNKFPVGNDADQFLIQ